MRERTAKSALDQTRQDMRLRSVNTTADRAIDILLVFSSEKPFWSAAEIGQHFKMPRSTTYRYVNTLRACGLIADENHNQYRLGHKILQLARVAKMHDPVLRLAGPMLSELSARFGETILLHERNGCEMITLERIESRRPVTVTFTQGQLLPWPAAPSAKILLAFAEEKARTEILKRLTPIRYTKKTASSKQALLADLNAIVKRGYAIGEEELDEGVSGVAAPIFHEGACRYAVSACGPSVRFRKGQLKDFVEGVSLAAARISKALSTYA